MKHVRTTDIDVEFAYLCECAHCSCAGTVIVELGDREPFPCPGGCGALYVLYDRLGTPDLMCVVCPVQAPADEGDSHAWLCDCGHWEESGLCCTLCGREPPWGCDCGAHDEADNKDDEDYDP